MHGYAGVDTNYPEEIDLIDDSDPPNASNFDVAPQGLADRTAYLRRLVQGTAIETWSSPQIMPGGGASLSRPVWDPVNGIWLFGYQHSPSGGIQAAYGLPGVTSGRSGILGTVIGGIPFIRSVFKDPTDADTFYVAAIGVTSDGFCHVWRFQLSTGVYTAVATFTDGSYTDAELWCFGGSVILATVTTTTSKIRISRDQGATWSTPASDTCNGKWILRDNGAGTFLALTSSRSGGLAPHALLSNDGQNFFPMTIGSLSAASTLNGLAWGNDANGPCWIALSRNGSHGSFWRSADGVSWADVSDVSNLLPNDLGAIGKLFVTVGVDSTFGFYVAYSYDGCVTWHKTQAYFQGTNPIIGASPNQLVVAFSPLAGADQVLWSSVIGASGIEVA